MARASVGFVPWSQAAMDTAVVINFSSGWGISWHAQEDGKAAVTISDPVGTVRPLDVSVVEAEELASLISWTAIRASTSRVHNFS